jgi:hypothetical protein
MMLLILEMISCTLYLELAQVIIALTKSKSKIVHLAPLADGDMTRRQPDNSKMKEILGRELLQLEKGIELMINDKRFLNAIGL